VFSGRERVGEIVERAGDGIINLFKERHRGIEHSLGITREIHGLYTWNGEQAEEGGSGEKEGE
jgi:hypothetical protein